MNYKNIYKDFIKDRKAKEQALLGEGSYFERHHITPKSLGGSNNKSNIISLTAGDHYFAHLLLAMAYGGKMWIAVTAMANMKGSSKKRNFFVKRRWVEVARIKAAKVHSKNTKLQHKNGLTKLAHSEEAKAKRSATMKKIAANPEWHKKRIAGIKSEKARKNYRIASKKMWQENPKAKVWRENQRKRFLKINKENNPAQTKEGRAKIKEYSNRPEVILKRKLRIEGDKNPTKRLEVRKKISLACKKRDMSKTSGMNKKVINLDTKKVFYNIAQARLFIGIPKAHISDVCKGKRKSAGGYRWAYV
jgi:hypothetical protein